MGRIRVLIVDDSAFMRHALGRLLSDAADLEVVGAASNGEEGLRLAAEYRPDVITLDVEMPVLDGLGMLRRLMLENPARVVMLSSRTTENAQTTLDALEYGAIDFVPKPSGSLSIDIGRVGDDLISKIRTAAAMSEAAFLRHRQVAVMNLTLLRNQPPHAPLSPQINRISTSAQPDVQPQNGSPPQLRTLRPAGMPHREPYDRPGVAARKLVVIASSTGGPSALQAVVKGLPAELGAAVAIVQHMPPGFTASLAQRLDAVGLLPCSEATTDDVLSEDRILLAPGDVHMIASSSGHIQLVKLPAVNGVRPAADVTLQAVAPIWRGRMLCVVLTGMGCDGREGSRAVKEHGGTVFSQDAATSTIYGMPAAVANAGLSDEVHPLHEMGAAIAEWCGREQEQTGQRPSPEQADRSAMAS